jgi:ATP-binding cassette subfamily F protein 3
MLLKPMNLLILDEPTNHLDLQSKDILLDTLRAYPGTIIFVSHDRAFMEALSTKTLELSPLGPRLFYGNYAYYLDRASAPTLTPPSPGASSATLSNAGQDAAVPDAQTARNVVADREAGKQRQTLLKRLERQEAEILAHIEELETEKARLGAELARPDVYSSGEKARAVKARLDETTARIEATTTAWEAKAAELETARN